MPYKIVEFGKDKYKVKKDQRGRPKYFSKKYLTYEQAHKQYIFLNINVH